MTHFKSIFSALLILLLAGCASDHRSLYDKKPAFYAYIFGDVEGDRIIAEYEADVYATPASCQKIITALLAYKTFGGDWTYETKLFVTKKRSKTQDVIISFSGDPTFQRDDLVKLLTPLKGSQISGRIILDASLYKTPPHSPNIIIDDVGTDYAQPVSAMTVDKNIILVTVEAGKDSSPARLTNTMGYVMDADVMTSTAPSSIKLKWRGDRIVAMGNMNADLPLLELKISPVDIDPYMIRKVRSVLEELKIKGKVEVIRDENQLPTGLTVIHSVRSAPLRVMIPPALKASDNLVFDSLYLKIIHHQKPVGIIDWGQGDEIIKSLIKQHFGIDMGKALLVDGSGLSRYNRIQPRKLFELLRKGHSVKEFVEALPSPGELNTTLVKRTHLPLGIKAKTGGMSGINCLCGYYRGTGNVKSFVIMASSFAPPASEMYPVMDAFIHDKLAD